MLHVESLVELIGVGRSVGNERGVATLAIPVSPICGTMVRCFAALRFGRRRHTGTTTRGEEGSER